MEVDPTVARRKKSLWRSRTRDRSSLRLCAITAFFFVGTNTHKQRPATHARTHTHKKTACVKSGSTIHTGLRLWSPPGEGSRWSRSLDDVVEELHGLHDVFILEGDEELGVSQEADVGSF